MPATLRLVCAGAALVLPALATARALALAMAMAPHALPAKVAVPVTPLLRTLKDLVGLESDSRDLDGLDKTAEHTTARLQAAGMTVKSRPAQAPGFGDRCRVQGAGAACAAGVPGSGPAAASA
ncbi:MAG: hypothetical protein C0505_05535 [Leptothrix sp. (in: Bacteria)]|nr:hypothetical protein [Leptothrix sp. (in: b-proteobacteria)]